jgi:hypothetical protein
MGRRGAPDDINESIKTYVKLAEGTDADLEGKNGSYWRSNKVLKQKAGASDERKQDKLVKALEKIAGVSRPE